MLVKICNLCLAVQKQGIVVYLYVMEDYEKQRIKFWTLIFFAAGQG